MKKTSLLLLMGVLVFSLMVTAFVTAKADASPALQVTSTSTQAPTLIPTKTPTALPLPNGGSNPTMIAPVPNLAMIQLWDQVCVKKVPFTILAIPLGATFELVAPDGSIIPALLPNSTPVPGQNSCKAVLNLGDRQVVVCSGQQGTSFTLRVTNGSTVEDFVVPLKVCPLKPVQPVTDTPIAPPTEVIPTSTPGIPTIIPTLPTLPTIPPTPIP